MKCPVDGETLVMTDRSGVEIDYCPKCRGVWLDRGELDKIIERSETAGASATGAPTGPARGAETGQGWQGEVRRVVEGLRGDDGRRDTSYRRDDWDDGRRDGRYEGRRKKSLLGELFDF